MNWLVQLGLGNALLASVMGLVALCAGFAFRRPALVHAMWLIVLLKLLTPPLWTVSMDSWMSRAEQRKAPSEVRSTSAVEPQTAQTGEVEIVWDEPRPSVQAVGVIARPQTPRFHVLDALVPALLLLWVAGSVFCAALAAVRIIRFRRLLRFAVPAEPDVIDRAAAAAVRLGLARSPEVFLVPGAVCPMLWAAGGAPRLLIPAQLWETLSRRQRDTLLLHELAHLKRRDHWVRGLELCATVLYWWHPVLWFARRRLREAEEQCCDAWVLWGMPGSNRDYSSALLEAVEFLSRARPALPVLASGMAEFHHLRRRLIMIKQGNVQKGMNGSGWSIVLGIAGLLLPVLPTWGQTTDPAKPAEERDLRVLTLTRTEAADEKPADVEVQFRPVQIERPAVDATELRKAREEVQRLAEQLKAAKQRLAKLEGGPGQKLTIHYRELIDTPVGTSVLPREMQDWTSDVHNDPAIAPATDPRATASASDQERRLADLEKKLDRVLNEVQRLKNDRGADEPASAPRAK
jgi:beta-lactamase regulating signal transducer with metallopeptidase domain